MEGDPPYRQGHQHEHEYDDRQPRIQLAALFSRHDLLPLPCRVHAMGAEDGTRRVGWGTRIRTWVCGSKVRSPTTRRSPSVNPEDTENPVPEQILRMFGTGLARLVQRRVTEWTRAWKGCSPIGSSTPAAPSQQACRGYPQIPAQGPLAAMSHPGWTSGTSLHPRSSSPAIFSEPRSHSCQAYARPAR